MTHEDFYKALRIKQKQSKELAPFSLSVAQRRLLGEFERLPRLQFEKLMEQTQRVEMGVMTRPPGRTTDRGWHGDHGADGKG